MLRVSVVIRSFGRLLQLRKLLEAVLAQDHESFEVIVVEQTPEPNPHELVMLEPLFSDPRVTVSRHRPLGGPAARNTGARLARGEILLFIDDDDMPLGTDWIGAHERAYDDPHLMGLTARHVRTDALEPCPYPLRPLIRQLCMSYSFLKTPWTFARLDQDVSRVDWLHGTNASIRRELALAAGLWDETVRSQDEHSLAYKLHRMRTREQYFAFRAHPPVLRGMRVAGGMAKRRARVDGELRGHLQFFHRVLGRYHPLRYRLLYPAYLGIALYRTLDWVWDEARGEIAARSRLRHSAEAILTLPSTAWRELQRDPLT